MDFYFIELPKFNKPVNELNNITDKWIYFIKEAENLHVIPDNIDDEGLKEAYADANQNTWSRAELDAYNYASMREQDYIGRVQKALQKGKEEGKREGKEEGKEEAVIGLDKIGLDSEKIAEALNMSIERVNKIIMNYKNTDKA
jgi:predicted transposase/invertase (TIGR01784 family)